MFMYIHTHTHTELGYMLAVSSHAEASGYAKRIEKRKTEKTNTKKKTDLSKLGDIPAVQEQLQEYLVRNEQS